MTMLYFNLIKYYVFNTSFTEFPICMRWWNFTIILHYKKVKTFCFWTTVWHFFHDIFARRKYALFILYFLGKISKIGADTLQQSLRGFTIVCFWKLTACNQESSVTLTTAAMFWNLRSLVYKEKRWPCLMQ